MGGDEVGMTPTQNAAYEAAIKEINNFNTKWRPLQDEFMKRVDDMHNNPAPAMGRAVAGVKQQAGDALQSGIGRATSSGIQMGAGKFTAGLSDLNDRAAAASGLAKTSADLNNEQRYASNLGAIVQTGQQERNIDAANLNQAAALSGELAMENAQRKNAEKAGMMKAITGPISSIGGMALGGALGGIAGGAMPALGSAAQTAAPSFFSSTPNYSLAPQGYNFGGIGLG